MKLGRKKAAQGRQPRWRQGNDAVGATYRGSNRDDRDIPVDRQPRQRGAAAAASAQAKASRMWRFWLQRTGLLILLVALVISVCNVLSLSTNAEIKPVTQSGSGSFLRSQATYQSAADKLLAASIWNRNKITIDTAVFNRNMMAQFPELASVSVSLPLLAHRPVVYIQPSKATAVLNAANGSFVIDDNGKALLPSAQLPSAGQLPQITDQSGLHVELNHQVLTADDVNFIQTVLAELSAKHIGVSSLVLPASSRELDVYIAGQPYYVKFNLQSGDARQQAGTFLAALSQLQKQHVTPPHYVDVRVDGRAYYQ
ncbi:MAG TPA: hypothetical protein VHB72_00620 [Candidatus Saccharimonadales bacterium]|nr:hypothetical protein [Candidatus Saccharimonadales bacterium]